MSELHSDLYVKHQDARIHQLLHDFFAASDMNSEFEISDWDEKQEHLGKIVKELNPEQGEALLAELLENEVEEYWSESISEVDGFWVVHMVNGGDGMYLVGQFVTFLNQLVPSVQAQAWGCGDDDPWEFWLKYENGELVEKEDQPFEDPEEDEEIKNTIYAWWHKGLPATISVGLLASDAAISLEGKHMFFTGAMAQGTREEMEAMAEEQGAIVQKAVNGKTELLVVGEKPGASKLTKAQALGIKVISEDEFYRLVADDCEDEY